MQHEWTVRRSACAWVRHLWIPRIIAHRTSRVRSSEVRGVIDLIIFQSLSFGSAHWYHEAGWRHHPLNMCAHGSPPRIFLVQISDIISPLSSREEYRECESERFLVFRRILSRSWFNETARSPSSTRTRERAEQLSTRAAPIVKFVRFLK